MRVYRITRERFIHDLSGEGARLYGGRWNSKGTAVLYTSDCESLAALEVLVHTSIHAMPEDLMLAVILIPDSFSIVELAVEALPDNWNSYPSPQEVSKMGTDWVLKRETPAIKVPSVLSGSDFNYLINPLHKKSQNIEIIETRPFTFDPRINPL